MDASRRDFTNRLLACLSGTDFALLRSRSTLVDLPLRMVLEARSRRTEHVYFLQSGLASVVVVGGSHDRLEVGMIGREGMTGLSALMGVDRPLYETFVQTGGQGWRISAEALRDAMTQSPGLRCVLLRYGHTMVAQMAFTALANGRYNIAERLARWLLMAQDRANDMELSLTHEFLALMLGVRRPGVTEALNRLEKQGMIESRRGVVRIISRAGLEEAANGGYGGPEAEYERLFGAFQPAIAS